jgi:hypothetical protein
MRVHRAASSLSQRNDHPGNPMLHAGFQTRASGMRRKFSDDATMDEIMHGSPAAPETAAVFVDRAERIATSLKLAMFFRLAPAAAGRGQ